ncbi:hypothetical protein I6F43_12415 [Pseudoalteromonas sp. NZS71_1]|uniref:hypothetical protein n=1 Tax=Pseudoalteromonas sp. NZS71_1 TaxID=2792072 RepID=UPI0018CE2146|nr:hypothetical protein [Pseudoalteromonas sp. NZS71_1]MBH0035480.1 hypothetical protein [Pseudoalteromonas sp. NZS71_1]
MINKASYVLLAIGLYFFLLYLSVVSMPISIALMVFTLVFLTAKGIVTEETKWAMFILVSLNLIYNSYNFSPISGPDELAFVTNLREYNISELLTNEMNRFLSGFGFISSRITFSAFLSFLLPLDDFSINEFVIIILNCFLWFMSCRYYMVSLHNNKHIKDISLGFFFLLVSPSLLYWASNFGKDVAVISMCLFSASFYINKKYALFCFFLLLAMLLRPYSIIMVFCYVLPFCFTNRKSFFYVACIIGVFLLGTGGSVISLINSIIGFIYFFLSPNPMSASNWALINETNDFLFSPLIMLLESLIIFLLVAYGLVFRKYDRKVVFKTFVAIYCLSICLVGVGFTNMDNNNIPLAIGSLGDNFIRKKIIVWPLIALLFSTFYARKYK